MTSRDLPIKETLRNARTARKLSRAQVAAATGIDAGRLSRIETGGSLRDDERVKLEAYYQLGGSTPVQEDAGTHPALVEVQAEEWCGLVRGDIVKLVGDQRPRRTYMFLRHVAREHESFVEVKAPSGGVRPVRPEKIMRMERRGGWVVAQEVKA